MSVFVLQDGGVPVSRRIDYSRELNQEQLDVVLNGDGPCLVLAGAGSGKTRTVTYRVAYLLEQGVDPQSIMLLTFTNKAAREMMQRVESLLGQTARGVWGGTFHSTANRILRSGHAVSDYGRNFTILDQEDSQSLIKAVMKELKIDPKARRFPTAAVLQNVVSFARNTLQSVGSALELKHENFLPLLSDIEAVAEIYARRKREANVMDFDDLLANWLGLLNHPDIGPAIAGRFKYVLVDEYQDTNAIQAAIIRQLGGVHGNVLVVGDDAQSIYAFRGADVKNILDFPNEWPKAKIFKLLTNYRSAPEILELANESLQHNTKQFQKDLRAVRGAGVKPNMVAVASASQEARYVAEQILSLRAQGTALGNMAVLFRSSAHSQALEFELMKRDVPYEYRGGMKFFERAHIKDALSHLRVIHNVHDEVAWLRILNLQTGIGAATAGTLVNRIRGMESIEMVLDKAGQELPSRATQGFQVLVEMERDMLAQAPAPAFMLRTFLQSPYRDYLEREYPDWRDRFEDLEQLVVFAENYHDLSSFLADIALYDEVAAKREEADASGESERIILSTIHQAKGLEWDTVFIIHLADSFFPNKRAMGEEGGIEEERRLFYVAVTRAKQRLFLCYPVTAGYDALMFNQPSLFIEELSPRLMERIEVREEGASRTAYRAPRTSDDWSWDEGYEEPSIEIDRYGNRNQGSASKTVWKSSTSNDKKKPSSFLRDVDEL